MEDGPATSLRSDSLDLSMLDDFGMVDSPPGIIPTVTEARTVIGQKLGLRPSEADLVSRNIIPSNATGSGGQGVHPALHANMQRLHQAKVNDTLNRRIGIRPTPEEMQQRHLLPTTTHHASITEKHKQIAMGQRAQLLEGHMDTRPGPLDLVDKGILPPVNDSFTIKREPTPNIMAGGNLSAAHSPVNNHSTSLTGALNREGSDSVFAPKAPPLPPLLSNARPPTELPSSPQRIHRPSSYTITSPDGILQLPGYEQGELHSGGMPGKLFSFEDVTQPQQPTSSEVACGQTDITMTDTSKTDTLMAQVPATPEQIQHGHIVQEQLITQVHHVEPNATRLGPFSPALNPVLEDLGEVARNKHQVNAQLQAVQAQATLPHSGIRARLTAYGQQGQGNPKKGKAKQKKKIKKISFQQYTYPGTGDKKEKRKIKRASTKKPYAMPARPSSNRSLVLQQQAQWLQIQSIDDGSGVSGGIPSSAGNSPRATNSPNDSPQQQQILQQRQAAQRVFGGLHLPQFGEQGDGVHPDAMVIDRDSTEIEPSTNSAFPSVAQAAAADSPQPQQWSVGHQASRLLADPGRGHQRASSWGGGMIDPATLGLGDTPARHVPEPRPLTHEIKSEMGGSESNLDVLGVKVKDEGRMHPNYFQTRPASFHGLTGGGSKSFGSSSAALLKPDSLDPGGANSGYGSAPRSPLSFNSGPPPTAIANPHRRSSADGLSALFPMSSEGGQGGKLDDDIFDISMPDVDASFLDGLNLDGLGTS